MITATQMLESMTESPVPTRAEVTDVANAVLEGTDVVMLSGETSIGKYPVEAVRRMSSIAAVTEETLYPFTAPPRSRPGADGASGSAPGGDEAGFTRVIASLAGHAAREVGPKAIVVFSRSGRTARLLSAERPRPPVVAFVAKEAALRRLALHWGVVPRPIPEEVSAEDLLRAGESLLVSGGWVRPGDTVVFVLGTSTSPGATNSLKIAKAGDVDREVRAAQG